MYFTWICHKINCVDIFRISLILRGLDYVTSWRVCSLCIRVASVTRAKIRGSVAGRNRARLGPCRWLLEYTVEVVINDAAEKNAPQKLMLQQGTLQNIFFFSSSCCNSSWTDVETNSSWWSYWVPIGTRIRIRLHSCGIGTLPARLLWIFLFLVNIPFLSVAVSRCFWSKGIISMWDKNNISTSFLFSKPQ